MKVQMIRHATLIVTMNGVQFLIDPMLSPAGTMDPAANSENTRRNPLVELPSNVDLAALGNVDAMLITHTHRDHFDEAAMQSLAKEVPVLCQPEDVAKIHEAGFGNVTAVNASVEWNGVRVTRTGAQHGTGEVGRKMGPVSGYLLEAAGEPSLYITGDTVWCSEVEKACERFPDVVVAFAGGAEFLTGGPITMSPNDIHKVAVTLPESRIVAVHMDAWNHCLVTRDHLRQYVQGQGIGKRVFIPHDGEILEFS